MSSPAPALLSERTPSAAKTASRCFMSEILLVGEVRILEQAARYILVDDVQVDRLRGVARGEAHVLALARREERVEHALVVELDPHLAAEARARPLEDAERVALGARLVA